jgi:tetratricopeptide (TPR) repeat protein
VVRPPATPQAREHVAALRTRLAEATARGNAGQYAQALKLADSLVGDARQLGYSPVLAEALSERGYIEGVTGHGDAAVNTLLDASVAAQTGRDDHVFAEALMRLVGRLGLQARFAEAHGYARLGRAALARAGGDPQLEMRLDQNEATALTQEGRYDEALALEKQVLPRFQQLLGAEHPSVGALLINMAVAYERKGDPEQAIELLQHGISIFEKAYGSGHPSVAMAWNNLGAALVQKYDYRHALEALERALAILEAALGPNHPQTASTLSNVGGVLTELGQYERALTSIERANAIEIRTLGPEHPVVATSECHLAGVLHKLQRADAALSHVQKCLAIRERTLGPNHPDTAEALTLAGQCQLAQADSGKAIQNLERAVKILEHDPGAVTMLPEARFALAQALWDAGRERPRALSLAGAARPWEPIRPEVDAWLAKHR